MENNLKATIGRQLKDEPIFGDFFELEHVCELLHEQAEVADAPAGHSVHENGPVRLLHQRMCKQWDWQANEIEGEHPGLFERTYLARIYREADALLTLIVERPAALPGNLSRLELLMHKLYILPLRDFEEVQRELNRAKVSAREEGVKSEKAARSQVAKNSVTARRDKITRAAVLEWCKAVKASGQSADTVNDLQAMNGFKPQWSALTDKTLKKWAAEAGLTFKTGRPKSKK